MTFKAARWPQVAIESFGALLKWIDLAVGVCIQQSGFFLQNSGPKFSVWCVTYLTNYNNTNADIPYSNGFIILLFCTVEHLGFTLKFEIPNKYCLQLGNSASLLQINLKLNEIRNVKFWVECLTHERSSASVTTFLSYPPLLNDLSTGWVSFSALHLLTFFNFTFNWVPLVLTTTLLYTLLLSPFCRGGNWGIEIVGPCPNSHG